MPGGPLHRWRRRLAAWLSPDLGRPGIGTWRDAAASWRHDVYVVADPEPVSVTASGWGGAAVDGPRHLEVRCVLASGAEVHVDCNVREPRAIGHDPLLAIAHRYALESLEHGESIPEVLELPRRALTISVDGVAEEFVGIGDPAVRWSGLATIGDVTVTVHASGVDPSQCTLATASPAAVED